MSWRKKVIIADTGFWLALANKSDKYHQIAVEKLSQIDESLITTWPVLTETCHLLNNRLGNRSQLSFINSWQNHAFDVFDLSFSHVDRIFQLMKKYEDLPMDLADASLVILAEELKDGRILSTDLRDFNTYHWKNHHPFENILL